MSRIIGNSARRVQPTRKTARPDRPFGSGLTRFVPYAVLAPGFIEPADEDRAIVGQLFADAESEPEPDWDALAAEAEWQAQYEGLTPPPGHCRSCGEPAELLPNGLCDACDDMADEIGTATTNRHFGLGNRVF